MAGKKTVRHKSALKAARQALKRQTRNRAALSQVKTAVKNLKSALGTKASSPAEMQKTLNPLLNQAQKILMSAAQKKIIKKETASRKIARLSQAVHQASQTK